MWFNSLWLWRWLPYRLLRHQSLSTTTVLFNNTFTQTIILNVLMKWFLGSNLSHYFFFGDNKIWMWNVLDKDESLKAYCLLPLRWCKVLGYRRKQKYSSLILLCLHNWPIYTNMLKILKKRRSSQYAKQCMRSYWKFVAHSSLGFVFLTLPVHLLLSMH